MQTLVRLVIFVLLCGAGSAVFAQERGADERLVGWSADSQLLAIISNRTGKDELYIVDTSGNVLQQLFEGRGVWGAQVSPDGSTIAVLLSNPDDETINELHIVKLVSGETSQIATLPVSFAWQMVWSPDNRQLLLFDGTLIQIYNFENAKLTDVGVALYQYPRLVWSPDSQFIAIVSKEYAEQQSESVFVYDVAQGTLSADLLNHYWWIETYCCLTNVAWSPDSTQLAIAVMGDANIYLSDLTGSSLVPVAHTGGSISVMQWASDSSAIYYYLNWRTPTTLTPQEQLEGGRSGGIYRANVADGAIEALWTDPIQPFWVSFAPNGEQFYAAISGEQLRLGNLVEGEIAATPTYFKNLGLMWSPDSTMIAAVFCMSGDGDADLYLVDSLSGSPVPLAFDDTFSGEVLPSNCPGQG
jgi:Tol biopolymer transport system component